MEEPPLYPGDDFFLTAFYQLSSCRQVTDSFLGQIPWYVIIKYAETRELEPDVSIAFEHIISEMDTEYIKWQRKKQDALKPKGRSTASLRHTS